MGSGENARHGHGEHMDKVVCVERFEDVAGDEGMVDPGVLVLLEIFETRLSNIHGGLSCC